MPSLYDDIAAARQSGQTDDYLLNAYKTYDPSKADDINSALQGGRTSTDILDALASYDTQYGNHIENKGLGTKAVGALQSGVSQELSGLGNTAKQTLGDGAISGTLSSFSTATAPEGYQQASEGLGDAQKTLGDRAGYIPRSLLEGAPGLATDLAAGAVGARAGGALGLLGGPAAEVTVPVGAAIGGALGFGGSYLLRNYGNDAQKSAQVRTGDPNATPDTEDKQRAVAAGLVSAALSRVGVSKALGGGVAEAGADALLPAVRGLARAATVDAGTSAATDAANQALVDHANPLEDPSGLALSAVQGAAAGTGLRAVTAAGDANNAYKFRNIDPISGGSLADLYNGRDFSTPAASYASMKDVDRSLNVRADHWHQKTQPQLDALADASGYTDDTDIMLRMARLDLGAGKVVDPNTMGTLRYRLGDYLEGSNLMDALALQNTQNQLKAAGNFRDGPDGTGTFGGGIADTSFGRNVLNPIGKVGHYAPKAIALDVGIEHLIPGALHLDPTIATLLGATQVGGYVASRVFDKALRNSNPLAAFTGRFSSASQQ